MVPTYFCPNPPFDDGNYERHDAVGDGMTYAPLICLKLLKAVMMKRRQRLWIDASSPGCSSLSCGTLTQSHLVVHLHPVQVHSCQAVHSTLNLHPGRRTVSTVAPPYSYSSSFFSPLSLLLTFEHRSQEMLQCNSSNGQLCLVLLALL